MLDCARQSSSSAVIKGQRLAHDLGVGVFMGLAPLPCLRLGVRCVVGPG